MVILESDWFNHLSEAVQWAMIVTGLLALRRRGAIVRQMRLNECAMTWQLHSNLVEAVQLAANANHETAREFATRALDRELAIRAVEAAQEPTGRDEVSEAIVHVREYAGGDPVALEYWARMLAAEITRLRNVAPASKPQSAR